MKKKKINLLIENGTPKKIKDDAIVRLHINYWVEPIDYRMKKMLSTDQLIQEINVAHLVA